MAATFTASQRKLKRREKNPLDQEDKTNFKIIQQSKTAHDSKELREYILRSYYLILDPINWAAISAAGDSWTSLANCGTFLQLK